MPSSDYVGADADIGHDDDMHDQHQVFEVACSCFESFLVKFATEAHSDWSETKVREFVNSTVAVERHLHLSERVALTVRPWILAVRWERDEPPDEGA
jgi:hypothetical protein